jgi:hypothetical protein
MRQAAWLAQLTAGCYAATATCYLRSPSLPPRRRTADLNREVPLTRSSAAWGAIGIDRSFLPRDEETVERWISVDRAYYAGISLPPVELYKIGSVYFVEDGNHRVSVARAQGQQFVEAHVVEIDSREEVAPQTDLLDACGCGVVG